MSDKYVFERATMEDLADSVRSVVGTTEGMTATEMSSELSNFSTNVGTAITNQDTLIAQINAAIEGKSAGGVVLPELTNPASAENIDSGYEVVDGEGNLLTGTSTKVQLPILSNPASSDQILDGYESIDGDGNKITGTVVSVKAASGTINSTNSKTVTISGLDFQPSKIFLLSKGASTNKAVDGIGYMSSMDCSLSVMGDNYQRYPYRNGGMFTVTPNSDGFTATIDSSFDATFKTGPYYWMAME